MMYTLHRRQNSASRSALVSTSQVEQLYGPSSVDGALKVISMMQSRRHVTKLVLGHTDLGDDGCEVLFRFLSSEQGQRYHIINISLNSNGIGDRGLRAITEYLKDNSTLKELFLQNNAFSGAPEVVADFTEALNSSQLEVLSLTTNPRLSDAFIERFLPALDAPFLRDLQLSVLGMTSRSAAHIIEYISSHRCRLRNLSANGNRLGTRGVRFITRALKRHNFSLTTVEMFSNGLFEADASEETSGSEDADTRAGAQIWQESVNELRRILVRNAQLKHATEREALGLLRYARALLFRPRGSSAESFTPTVESRALVPRRSENLLAVIGTPVELLATLHPPSFPFTKLPMELQLYILSFLAPTLSSAQRLRIYTFAASPATLPPLLPNLLMGCRFPNHSVMPLGGAGIGLGMMLRRRNGSSPQSGTTDGKGSVSSLRDEEKSRWLTLMRCDAFELEEDGTWISVNNDDVQN
ncbi:RNI-like protein [Wolfiporia cocos MD-104 SS10]|uniref:RNI-like protein n=1 Tax=Wolfiporia cocos (strain MD-104) TaxID=742152 RepID=A0A2H3JG75_WOLCO|nr:RNI-like protein [Wolfiporia cocos MD-104 SS10]